MDMAMVSPPQAVNWVEVEEDRALSSTPPTLEFRHRME